MDRLQLQAPPDPNSAIYSNNPDKWQTAMYMWALGVKSRLETNSAINIAPVAPFVVSTYTAVNTMTGTDALSNFLATFITALQNQGRVATSSPRTTT